MTEINIEQLNDAHDALLPELDSAVEKNDQAEIDVVIEKLEKLASQGCGMACLNLGRIFYGQLGYNKKDELSAIDYFEQAVKLKVPKAFWWLGGAYDKQEEYERSFQLYQQGAELGCDACMNHVGRAFLYGAGTAKDKLTGLRWYKKAAEAGNNTAKVNYALELVSGKVISADLPKAIEMLEQAYQADKDPRAAWQLALAFEKQGKNGDSNAKAKSDEWVRIAADLGQEDAVRYFGNQKKNEQWTNLKNFSDKSVRYSFFTRYGTVVNKRTETTGSVQSSGQAVWTKHTNSYAVDLRDKDGNIFVVYPDASLPIATGTPVEVVYICNADEDTGYPFIMVDMAGKDGKYWEIKTFAKARQQVLKSLPWAERLLRQPHIPVTIAALPILLIDNSFLLMIWFLAFIVVTFKGIIAESSIKSSFSSHIGEIVKYFQAA